MIMLLINSAAPAEASSQTCFGGLPIIPDGTDFSWPICRSCDGTMQFLGRIFSSAAGQRIVMLFMCQNEPGLCEEWDANAGGNTALVVQATSLRQVLPPQNGNALRLSRYGADIVEIDAPDYDAARESWSKQTGRPMRHVLGQISGSPSWLQADETPICECCNEPMRFVAQLEQGPDWETEMNFGGGGVAYAFVCNAGKPSAKFLWQC